MTMTDTFRANSRARDGSLSLDYSGNPASRIWVQAALLLLALAIPSLLAYAIDDRTLYGISVWTKPLKFQLSVSLHLVTLAVATALLADRLREGRLLKGAAWLSAAMAMFEIAYITAQAARGRASHFNSETPLEIALYGAMGLGAVILVATSALVGVLLLRSPRPGVSPGLRLGGGLGLIVGSVLTLAVAGYLSQLGGHWIGGEASDASGLPVTGWSTTGGDIRVSHFLATHMMQGLPLIGLAADRLGGNGRRTVLVAGGLWTTAVAATFIQALAGQPLL
jgi:hypothetical protein